MVSVYYLFRFHFFNNFSSSLTEKLTCCFVPQPAGLICRHSFLKIVALTSVHCQGNRLKMHLPVFYQCVRTDRGTAARFHIMQKVALNACTKGGSVVVETSHDFLNLGIIFAYHHRHSPLG